jgi:hypothetical protein
MPRLIAADPTRLIPRKDKPIWHVHAGSTRGYWRPAKPARALNLPHLTASYTPPRG